MSDKCKTLSLLERHTAATNSYNLNLLIFSGGSYGCPRQPSQEMQHNTYLQKEDIYTTGFEAGYKADLDEQIGK